MYTAEMQPICYTKKALLGESPIYHNLVDVRRVYDTKVTLADLHFHEFIEVSIVLSGTGVHRIWNASCPCRAGDIYIFNTDVPHNYFAKNEQEWPVVCNLLFDPEIFRELDFGKPDSAQFCAGIFQENPSVAHLILKPRQLSTVKRQLQRLMAEADGKRLQWLAATRAELTVFLIMLRRLMQEETYTPHIQQADHNLVTGAMRIVTTRFSDASLTLESVAQALFVSKSQLSRVFLRCTGEHFFEYVRNIRLEQACRLLRQTNLTNLQIVRACGLKDVPAFYRLFREKMDMTPGQYRKNAGDE